jgi:hypothetical protein
MLSVPDKGRTKKVPLLGAHADRIKAAVLAYRQFRKARARMAKTFQQLLQEVNRIQRLREIPWQRFQGKEVV